MKNYVVTKSFQDKHDGKYYGAGHTYSTTDENRAAELQNGGFIAPEGSEMAQQALQAQNQKTVEAVEPKTVVNGKVVPLRQAQADVEQAANESSQTGVQAHHDNSGEAVQAGKTAQQSEQVQKYQQEQQHTIKEANVQSGKQTKSRAAASKTTEQQKDIEEKEIMEKSMNQQQDSKQAAKAKTTKKAD